VRPLVISHAACKGHAPENTLAGIRAALALGAEAIEIDVHCTADGALVLLHDDSVDRTTDGSGDVRTLTLNAVRRLDASAGWPGATFRGEPVPTLAETLDLTRGKALLVIEIKQAGIEQAVADCVRRLNAMRDAMVWTFQPNVVRAMRAVAPEIPCGQTWSARTPDIEKMEKMLTTALIGNAQAVEPEHTMVDAALVHAARRSGLRVYTWTPDDPTRIAELAALGVDGICTNFPERVAALPA
jgi:glycerophosphoryl diester phosphodiesterase